MASGTLSFDTANGATTAYVAEPNTDAKRGVIVIQEWWGLVDHIKDIAERWAAEGFFAIAPDLYRGKKAANADEAGKLMHELQIDDGIDTIRRTIETARDAFGITHFGI